MTLEVSISIVNELTPVKEGRISPTEYNPTDPVSLIFASFGHPSPAVAFSRRLLNLPRLYEENSRELAGFSSVEVVREGFGEDAMLGVSLLSSPTIAGDGAPMSDGALCRQLFLGEGSRLCNA